MSTTHQESWTGVVAASTVPPVEFAWSFLVVNVVGRLTSGRVVVTPTGLIVITTPDGGSFAVDPEGQFTEFSAVLRQARQLAYTTRERNRRTPEHWRE